ncbi:MAG: MCE family protein [Bacteroidetes bacterium]|nr:MCE family protein [Bacteroidota bacterium]MBL0065640.1 MCE family protein [Bacteroidota bacterium]
MNEKSNKRPVLVGVFVMLGLIFLVIGILMVGNLHETFKKKMTVLSLFDDVSGLQTGNNVTFSGVKIGTVSELHFYGNSQVAVRMKIETKVLEYIRKDAKVKIGTDGIIGNKMLIIYGGTVRAPEVEDGDTLSVDSTFSSEDMINTLQENNKNFLAITNDFKIISKRLAQGDGAVGKMLTENSVYDNINSATASLKIASAKAQQLVNSLADFSAGLNKKGTLANELTTDTIVFNSLKASVLQLQQIADTASVFISNLKEASTNTKTPIGVLLHDEKAGAQLKVSIDNLESSSKKLDDDLEAAQHNFLLRGYFKKKAKSDSIPSKN